MTKSGAMSIKDKTKLESGLFAVGLADNNPTRYYLLAIVPSNAYNPVHIEGRVLIWTSTVIGNNVKCLIQGSTPVHRGSSAKTIGYVKVGSRTLIYVKVAATQVANLVVTATDNEADCSTYVTTEPEGITWIL